MVDHVGLSDYPGAEIMGDPYQRRDINLDKLSSYVRRTGICTEEAALHLMDEIMFLRAEIKELKEGKRDDPTYLRDM